LTGQHTNRLINETSPYLLQHANNPVDWYPWGPDALERAQKEDKPIVLSIGYAACHWCHVMEHESFEDPEIAALMNENFVCIKVDREERPDIDSIYMDAVQAMTGQGGWPMTMFLTPAGEPFYGGTYFPLVDSHGLPSFRRLLESVARAWREQRDELQSQGRKLAEHIATLSAPKPSREPLDSSLLTSAFADLSRSFDSGRGGFGGPPKFPQAPLLSFLLRGPDDYRQMVFTTLDRMARGGIYDQIGGGFHRYSVDGEWLVPHFEKMLYDNAQLARVYVNAWQASGNHFFSRIAAETLEYLLRDMRHESGAFFSSEDADSEGVEGKFYVWDYDEFMSIAPEVVGYYGVTQEGNFEGTNILTAGPGDPPLPPIVPGRPPREWRDALLKERSKRVRPGLDDKILTSWNSLAVAAFAEAGAALDRADFREAAEVAAGFLLDTMRPDGRLLHSFKDGRARILGMLEDYAYLAEALITLWEATLEPRWIEEAIELAQQMLDLFGDSSNGGLFSTGADHERLIVRQKEIAESATPSPMGVASLVLQRLSVITGDQQLAATGADNLRLAHPYMQKAPQAVPSFLSALDFYLATPKEIVVVAPEAPQMSPLFRTAWMRWIPNRVIAGAPPGINSPMLEGKEPLDGTATAFVCEHYVCKAPTTDPETLAAQLD
jgi:uncharacterized protein YyaL (SSP411 family)